MQDSEQVLTALLTQARLGTWQLNDIEQRNLLSVFIEQRRAEGSRLLIAIDDAQTFTRHAWQEVERLALLKHGEEAAVELVIGTHNEDDANASDLIFSSPAKRTHKIFWLDPDHVDGYITWRIERFGLAELFTATAKHLIARYTAGSYRGIDLLCQMTLLLLKRYGLPRVDVTTVDAAVQELARNHVKAGEASRGLAAAELDLAPAQGRLIITRLSQVVARIVLGERTLIGRSEFNDICLESPHVSRHHTAIVRTPTGFYIADLNSSNGTVLNGKNVSGAQLCDQDIVQVGNFRLKFEQPGFALNAAMEVNDTSLDTTAVMDQRSEHPVQPLRIVR